MPDILCIGSANLDAFLNLADANRHISLDTNKNKLCVDYGEKIEVEKTDFSLGGNASNTAVGLSRLGIDTALCAEIGKDDFSEKILKTLKDEKINTDLIIQTPNQNASFSIALNFKNERTLFVEHVKREHNFDFKGVSPRLVYLTSLGDIWENAYSKTMDFIEKTKCLLAFNPGTRQIHNKNHIISYVLSKTDYLFVNKDEAEELLYGKNVLKTPDDDPYFKKLLFELSEMGPKNIIITDGINGSYALAKDKTYKMGIINVKPIEKTGAGDSYNAGFLAAIISNQDTKTAMKWATIEATSVIRAVGAQQGLLTKEEMEYKLNQEMYLQAKEI